MPDWRDSRNSWLWPVLFVTSIHLLTTAGGWWITDHGEILASADRFLSTGRFELRDLGKGFEDWTKIVAARGSTETRFLPLSILALTPLLALDRLVGWTEPASFHFVHLQGHLCVGIGLALVGRFVGRTAGASAASLAGLLLGLNWPVWMIARRIGPEPLLFLLLAWFATGSLRSKMIVLLLVPWVHATGPLLGAGAFLWIAVKGWLEGSRERGHLILLAFAWIAGVSSLVLFWNLPVHGQTILGGYGTFLADSAFTLRSPLTGIISFVAPVFCWTLPLGYLAFRGGGRVAWQTLALWLAPVSFFGLLFHPALTHTEPERRLAPLLAIWTVAIMSNPPRLEPARAIGLVSLTLALGALGLSRDFVDTVPMPFGLFSGPRLFFMRLAFVEHQPLLAAGLLALLTGMACAAGSRALFQIQGARTTSRDVMPNEHPKA